MSIARIAQGKLTNQQIANFMLDADRDRRAAMRRGDYAKAAELQREVEKLSEILS